jgi:hypothetical protein
MRQFTLSHFVIFGSCKVDRKFRATRIDYAEDLFGASNQYMGRDGSTFKYSRCSVCRNRFESKNLIATSVDVRLLLAATPQVDGDQPITVNKNATKAQFVPVEESLKCTCVDCAPYLPANSHILFPKDTAKNTAAKQAVKERKAQLSPPG